MEYWGEERWNNSESVRWITPGGVNVTVRKGRNVVTSGVQLITGRKIY